MADIDPVTFNIDPVKIRQVLQSPPARLRSIKMKAIMPVHLYGQCADMTGIMEIAREYGLAVIEDACQAIGAECPFGAGIWKAGSIGEFGCFSFFPSKNLGGFGDGGMVTTNDSVLADKVIRLRNHGMHPKYYHAAVGGNFRLDALQAAVLEVKLKRLESWHAGRRRNAERYNARFAGTPVSAPEAVYRDSGAVNFHIYNQYVIRVPERDAVVARLRAKDIGCDIYYPLCLHEQECFRDWGYRKGDMPESERAAGEVLALPVYPEMTEEMVDTVADAVLSRS
jgi:dTDP-4-amino-4,6-dideoxygalactose transaminase